MTIIMSFCPTKVSTYVMLSIAKSTAPVVSRLVVQDLTKRKRIITSTHDGSNRTNSMVSSKYHWPGLFSDVRQYVS